LFVRICGFILKNNFKNHPKSKYFLFYVKPNLLLSCIIYERNYILRYFTDTSKITVENFDSAKTGKQTITVKYDNLSCCFDVTVSFAWWQWIIRILLLGFLWY